MASFIPNTSSDSNDTTAVIIKNDGWYPDIESEDFRNTMRVGDNIVNEQVLFSIQKAMLSVNNDLSLWQSTQNALHFNDIESICYGEETKLQLLYRSAIYNYAKALLVDSYRDYDLTKSGHDKADELETKVDSYRQLSIEAVRMIIQKPRISVELI